MEQVSKTDKTERRKYFRIDDVSILYHREISEGESEEQYLSDQLSIDKLTLKAKFESLDRELQPLRKSIEENNPKLTRYLAAIDNKLTMLSELLMIGVVDKLDEKPQKVNISAGGVSFESSSPIEPGVILELQIVLLPTNVGIYSHAKVVFCNKISDETEENVTYKIAVEFVRLDEEFRDMISRHVLGREQIELASSQEADD